MFHSGLTTSTGITDMDIMELNLLPGQQLKL